MAAENVGPAGVEADMNSALDPLGWLMHDEALALMCFSVGLCGGVVAVDAGSDRMNNESYTLSGFSESFLVDGPPNFASAKRSDQSEQVTE